MRGIMAEEKICFAICPIGPEGSEIREWADLTIDYIISPVVKEFGYLPMRADFIQKSGMITNQIVDFLVDSPLVIADLSNYNPNVIYELAIRHMVQKPCIEMIKAGQTIPFDISGMRTVQFNLDLKSAEMAKETLKGHIKSIENGEFRPSNPISLARTSAALEKYAERDTNTENESIPKLLFESINEMRSMIYEMKNEMSIIKNANTNKNRSLKNYVGSNDLNKLLAQRDKLVIRLDKLKNEREKLYKLLVNQEGSPSDLSDIDFEVSHASYELKELEKTINSIKVKN